MESKPKILNDQLLILLIYKLISKYKIKLNYSAKDNDILVHDQKIIQTIEDAAASLSKKEIEILRAKFGISKDGYSPKTFSEIAANFEMDHHQVKSLENSGIDKLFTSKVKDVLFHKLKEINDKFEKEHNTNSKVDR